MMTMTTIRSISNVFADPRASVGTFRSMATTKYAPSVFTFNADWAPAPLASPAADVFVPPTSRLGADGADDASGERVSHLDLGFDDDDGEDVNGDMNANEGRDQPHEFDDDDECYSPGPTPTQARGTYFRLNQLADSNAAYLASYGFTNGLGYERPPSDCSFSVYSDCDGEYDSATTPPAVDVNSKFAYWHAAQFPRSSPVTQQPSNTHLASNSALVSASASQLRVAAWPASLRQAREECTVLLSSLSLDAHLLNDPCSAWEALCWDEAAPDDSEFGDAEEGEGEEEEEAAVVGFERNVTDLKGGLRSVPEIARKETMIKRVVNRSSGRESWRNSNFLSSSESPPPPAPSPPPSPYPVFRIPTPESQIDIDGRTLSNETTTTTTYDMPDKNHRISASVEDGVVSSASDSTVTADDSYSEEWVSLIGARAQAARAWILPSAVRGIRRSVVPDSVRESHVSEDATGAVEETEDPIHAPVEAGNGADIGSQLVVEVDAETETAPHYGESGRDQLLTLPLMITEREREHDPPPYELEYEAGVGTGFTANSTETTQVNNHENVGIGIGTVPHPSFSTSTTTLSLRPAEYQARTRSQLTFPASPTDSDTVTTNIDESLPTPALSASASPITPTSPGSPLDSLRTPGGTFGAGAGNTFISSLSVLNFPLPRPEDSIHFAPRPASRNTNGNSSRPGSPLSFTGFFPSSGSGLLGHGTKVGSRQGQIGAGSDLERRPWSTKPLPARPRGARTTAGTWFSASIAGPYAHGTRSKTNSQIGFGINSSGGSASSNSNAGFTSCGGFSDGDGDGDDRGRLAVQVTREVIVDDRDRVGKGSSSSTVNLSRVGTPDKAHSHLEPESKRSTEKMRASAVVRSEQGRGSPSAEAGAGRPLQRFATRCGTLSRRIGIGGSGSGVGLGVVGKER